MLLNWFNSLRMSPVISSCDYQPLDSITHGKFLYSRVTMEQKDCMSWSISINWLITMGMQNWPYLLGILINPLNPELNPICYLLALLGAHHFLHNSRIRVKLLTFRRLMSYIDGAPILDVSRSHTTTQHSR